MLGFLSRLLASALGLAAAAYALSGMRIDSAPTLFAAAFITGLVNATVRPVVVFFTLPISILTLGLFLLVINAGMLALVAWLLPGFELSDFRAAFLGALIVSVVSWVASWFIGPRGRVDIVVKRGRRG